MGAESNEEGWRPKEAEGHGEAPFAVLSLKALMLDREAETEQTQPSRLCGEERVKPVKRRLQLG